MILTHLPVAPEIDVSTEVGKRRYVVRNVVHFW